MIVFAYSGPIAVPAAFGRGWVLWCDRAGARRAGAPWLGLCSVRRGVVGGVVRLRVEPVVAGLVMGLLTYAYPAARGDLERATQLFRRFREQPTPELARSAQVGLGSALSPNERLQELYHPWTSYLIVPLFALAMPGLS